MVVAAGKDAIKGLPMDLARGKFEIFQVPVKVVVSYDELYTETKIIQLNDTEFSSTLLIRSIRVP